MRRSLQQHLALDQRLAHQAELVVLEIAQAAMDELGRGRGGGAGEIALLRQIDLEAAPGRVAGDAAAVDAAANDRKVKDGRTSGIPSSPVSLAWSDGRACENSFAFAKFRES